MAGDIYLLDTNVLSNSSKPKPHPRVAEWLLAQRAIAIPYSSLLEMEIGIIQRRQDQPEKSVSLRKWMDGLLEADFEFPIMTPGVARLHAEMMCCGPITHLCMARSKGKKPGQDLLLAAIAVEYDMPIATLDWKDFGLIARHFRLPPVFNPAFGIYLPLNEAGFTDREALREAVA